MNTFDSHYAVEIKELIFPGLKTNGYIERNVAYVIDGDNKSNII